MPLFTKKTNAFFILFIVLIHCGIDLKAQPPKDSLIKTIKTTQVDSTKIRSIIELANTIGYTNSDSSILLYHQAIQESKQKKLKALNALAMHKLGNHYLGLGEFDSAMHHYDNCIKIREDIGDKKGLANILNNKGIIYSYTGEIKKSKENYFRSLNLRIDCNDSNGIAGSYVNLGMLFHDLGSIDTTIEFYQKSIKIHEDLGNEKSTANIYNNLGVVYKDKGDIVTAMDYYNKSLEISETLKDSSQIASIYSNIGLIYKIQGDFEKALKYYNKSLKLLRKIEDNRRISYLLQNLGGIYDGLARESYKNKQFKKADSLYNESLIYYQGSLATKIKIGDQNGIASSYINIGIVFLEKSKFKNSSKKENLDKAFNNLQLSLDISQRNENKFGIASAMNSLAEVMKEYREYDKALDYAIQSYNLAEELGNVESKKGASDILHQLYTIKGNDKLAFKYYKEHIAMRDSLAKEEDMRLMQQKYYQYEYEKQAAADSVSHANEMQIKNLEIEKHTERIQKQRTILIASILGFIILLSFSIMVYRMFRQKKKANILLNKQNKQIQEQKLEIENEKEKSDNLLLNILPKATANELKATGYAIPRYYKSVSVLFTDFKGFTKACAGLAPEEVVRELHMYFEAFDDIIEKNGLEKIKTIGDAYMCAGGLPQENSGHPTATINAAIEMQQFMDKLKTERVKAKRPYWDLRIGIHTGEIIAGVVGKKKFAYDIWGNTVNIASRMETACEPGKINISEATYSLVKDSFHCESRGKIEAKNVGAIEMYFVN